MADLDRIKRAIIAAEKAGDEPAARALVARYRELSGSATVPHGAVQQPGGGYAMPSLDADMGYGKTLAVAAGRGVDKMLAGAQQAYNWMTGDSAAQSRLDQQQKANDAAYAPIERDKPITAAIGETLPAVALTAPFGGGAGLLGATTRGAMMGAAPGLLSYGDVGERASRAAGGAVGGGVGGAAGYGLARALSPVASQVRASDDAIDAARRIGYSPTPGQITGNPMLQNLENYLARMPGSSSKMQAVRQGNQSAINRAAAKAIGETGDSVDEATLASAQARIGGEFDRIGLAANPDLQASPFLSALAKIDADNAALQSFRNSSVDDLVDRGLDLATQGKLRGDVYIKIRAQIGKEAASAENQVYKSALKDLQRALDDAASDSLSGGDSLALKAARQQWADFKTLARNLVVEGGDVSPRRVATDLARKYGDQFATGQANSGLMDIARVGRGLAAPVNPNSGSLLLTDSIANSPFTAIPAALVNKGLASTYLSPMMQSYLARNQLPPLIEGGISRLGQSAGLLSAGTQQSLVR